jgi:hypothetical protein
MLEHVRQGGRPYDIRGQHITDIVEELNVLGRFERGVARETVLEGDTAQLVSEAAVYRKTLKENLKRLGTGRGYAAYFESWNPVELSEQDVVIESLKHMFVKQTLDARIEQALPVLARIQQQGNAMKEANIFEAWADRLVEGTWSTPDSPEAQQKLLDLMSKELPVGADATNATEQLYDLLGDDKLFDLLESLAQQDPNADCRQVVLDRMQELSGNPDVRAVLEQLNIDADATMNPPESMPADLGNEEQAMAEGSKRLPDIRQFDKTVLDKQFGGSIVKMAQALKDAGFSHERIVQKINDFKQGVAEDAVRSLRRAAGLTEGRMLDEDKSKLDHILDRFKYEVREFEQGGDLAKELFDALVDYYRATGDMPYPVLKDDPHEWVAQNLESHLRGGGIIGGVPDDDYSLERESAGDYASEEMRAPHSVDGGMDNAILYDDSTCNMSEAGENCPVHGIEECYAESTMPNEGVMGAALGGIGGALVGGPVGALRGASIGNAIGDVIGGQETDESSPLAGIYGHSGKMQEVGKDTSFLDRLQELSGIRQA